MCPPRHHPRLTQYVSWFPGLNLFHSYIFTLYDGPPYANGDLHIGHALNKILKDFINRYKLLEGYKVHYMPSWDCHGLPIELKILWSIDQEARKDLTPLKLRKKVAQFSKKTIDSQRKSFRRYKIWGE